MTHSEQLLFSTCPAGSWPFQGLHGTHFDGEKMNRDNVEMRLPEEGAPTGAGPGMGVNANGQWPGYNRRPGRGMQQPEIQPLRQRSHTTSNAPPTESAAQDQSGLTQVGLPRRRMKWNSSMNEHIVRSYLKVTECEMLLVGYRQKLHREFLLKYPQLSHVSEQRVADQYRAIMRLNLIPTARISEIKEELRRNTVQEDHQHQTNEPHEQQENTEQLNGIQLSDATIGAPGHNLAQYLQNLMETTITEYEGTNPTYRPRIPKMYPTKEMINIIDVLNTRILPSFVMRVSNLEELHLLIYSSSIVIAKALNQKISNERPNNQYQNVTPKWEIRLTRKIEKLRMNIGHLTEYVKGIRSTKLEKSIKNLLRKHGTHSKYDEPNRAVAECLDTLKQKLSVIAARLKKYKTSAQRKKSNMLFNQNERNFYRKLKEKNINSNTRYPSQQEIQHFWQEQLSAKKHFNRNAHWIQSEILRTQQIEDQQQRDITTAELEAIIKSLPNWKAPGPEKLQNFWIKKLTCTWEKLREAINEAIDDPNKIPEFLLQGITYLLPKDPQNSQDPAKYRPITCLPTMYKIITSCIAKRIYEHCEDNNLIAIQQNGCKKGSKGCKEQLIIDSVVCNQAATKNRNLYTAFIDYKKAFDSVPHDWLTKVLEIYKISPKYIDLLKQIMGKWQTEIHLNTPKVMIRTSKININRGIFQGDSLSPLWFILAMNPLSSMLNSTGYGFSIKSETGGQYRLSHLLYMDDIKIYASKLSHLEHLLNIVEKFSKDICMNFGLDKCRTLRMIRGKLQEGEFESQDGQSIHAMLEGETYKYLGIKQAKNIHHTKVKEEIAREFAKRVQLLSKSFLKSKYLFKALNTYAIPVLCYSFGIIHWTQTDVEALERKIRMLLHKECKHHPKSAVERFTLPRYMGGRGLTDIANLLENQKTTLREYFLNKCEVSALHRAICNADESTPLRLTDHEHQSTNVSNTDKINQWMSKPLHGKHIFAISKENINTDASNYWLKAGQLFPETEGLMIAIQDQVIPTRNYLRRIVGDPGVTVDTCRYGCEMVENIQHVISGCTYFSGSEYKRRHDAIAKIVHQELAFIYNLERERKPAYLYQPSSVLENEIARLYWDRTILTDQTVQANRPDIVLFDKKKNKVILIDVAVPNTQNLDTKYTEKVSKYAPLIEPIKRQWKVKEVKIVPILISSTGAIPHNMIGGLEILGLHPDLYKYVQKSTVIATTRIVRRFMDAR